MGLQGRFSSTGMVWYLIKSYASAPYPLTGIHSEDTLRGLKRRNKALVVLEKRPRDVFFPLVVMSQPWQGEHLNLFMLSLLWLLVMKVHRNLRSRGFLRKFRVGRIFFFCIWMKFCQKCASIGIFSLFSLHSHCFTYDVVPKVFRVFQPLWSPVYGWQGLTWYLLILHVFSPKPSHWRMLLPWAHLSHRSKMAAKEQ